MNASARGIVRENTIQVGGQVGSTVEAQVPQMHGLLQGPVLPASSSWDVSKRKQYGWGDNRQAEPSSGNVELFPTVLQ